MKKIYRIHPAIGIARVGDSEKTDEGGNPTPESYYVGPESPSFGFEPDPYNAAGDGKGNYRDSDKNVRRQGARFRIYEHEIVEESRIILSSREITPDIAKVTWKVHLANRKGSYKRFPPYYTLTDWNGLGDTRNPTRPTEKLNITPNEVSISADENTSKAIKGNFLDVEVKLADLIVDDQGRLIVLGGHGKIFPKNAPLHRPRGLPQGVGVYNNDGVCDDTSDGKITATVEFHGGGCENLDDPDQRAWVIVAPPNFAPAVQSTITLYDVVREANVANLTHGELSQPPDPVQFTRDIYPFLQRIVNQRYVSKSARRGHDVGKKGDFLSDGRIKVLSSKLKKDKQEREYVVSYLTEVGATGDDIKMPKLYGGVNPEKPDQPPTGPRGKLDSFGIPLVVTPYQRDVLKLWAKGEFEADWKGKPAFVEFEDIDILEQPDALDRAALEDCAGGSFHPGIEGPYFMARPKTFAIPGTEGKWFRIAAGTLPGQLTESLAVPWHTDFYACTEYWWPAQRPNNVPVKSGAYEPWHRGVANAVRDLLDLGFVKTVGDDVIEDERRDQAGQ